MRFVDMHRDAHGVQPICRVLEIAPSGYWRRAARQRELALRSARARRDEALIVDIEGRRGPWKIREAVELATLEWVSWFNHQRLLAPIAYLPPAEAEAHYYRQFTEQAQAA